MSSGPPKLCLKCISGFLFAEPPELVSESECEFWAHKELNQQIQLERLIGLIPMPMPPGVPTAALEDTDLYYGRQGHYFCRRCGDLLGFANYQKPGVWRWKADGIGLEKVDASEHKCRRS